MLTVKWGKNCGKCGTWIAAGEKAEYDGGAKALYHPACAPSSVVATDAAPGTNKYPGYCLVCHIHVPPGTGVLKPNGEKKWLVSCASCGTLQTTLETAVVKLPDTATDEQTWNAVLELVTAQNGVVSASTKAGAAQKAHIVAVGGTPKKKKAAKAALAQALTNGEPMKAAAVAFAGVAEGILQQPELCDLTVLAGGLVPLVRGMQVAVRSDRRAEYAKGVLSDDELGDGRVLAIHALVEFAGIRALVPADHLLVIQPAEEKEPF